VTALREIKLLRELRGPYIVQLLDVFAHKRKNLQLVRNPHRLMAAFMQWREPSS
jgi:serine/threonine protein kinase